MVKADCFAYSREANRCTALKETFCRTEECAFYKTRDVFCKKCKTSYGRTITCNDCKTIRRG